MRKGWSRTKRLVLLGLILLVGLQLSLKFVVEREMLKEEKVLQVSFIQLNPSTEEIGLCMDRAIQMALNYYGVKLSISEIIANRYSMNYPSFEREMAYYGLKADGINLSFSNLTDLERIEIAKQFITSRINQGSPIVVGMQVPAHSVLIVGYKNQGAIVVYHDPAGFTLDYAYRRRSIEEFVTVNRMVNLWAISKAD